MRLEGVDTVATAYESAIFTQGLTYAHTPIGSPSAGRLRRLRRYRHPPVADWRPLLSASYEARDLPHRRAPVERRFGGGLSLARRWVKSEFTLIGRARRQQRPVRRRKRDTTAAGYFLFRYQFF